MKLYFVRHGDTEENKRGFRQTPDTPLSEKGRIESEKLAQYLMNIEVDILLSSTWLRAKETAKIFANKLNLQIKYFDELHEKEHNPDLYGVTMDSELHLQYVKESAENRNNFDWKLNGKGESFREMLNRGLKLKNKLKEEYGGKTVMAVSHAYFIKGFICGCLPGANFDDDSFKDKFLSMEISNSSVSLLEYDEKEGSWKVKFLNFIPNFRG